MKPMSETKARRDFKRGINLLLPVVRAVQRGEWKPTPVTEILLDALRRMLREVR